MENGNICLVQGSMCTNEGEEVLVVKVSGETPKGTITIGNGGIDGASLQYDGINKIVKDSEGNIVYEDENQYDGEQSGTSSICTLVNDTDNSGTVTAGDKYQCKVKDNMEASFENGYYFNVLNTNADGITYIVGVGGYYTLSSILDSAGTSESYTVTQYGVISVTGISATGWGVRPVISLAI